MRVRSLDQGSTAYRNLGRAVLHLSIYPAS
jgi:hypothetical protein